MGHSSVRLFFCPLTSLALVVRGGSRQATWIWTRDPPRIYFHNAGRVFSLIVVSAAQCPKAGLTTLSLVWGGGIRLLKLFCPQAHSRL
jgi:hypothetical protein